MQIEDIPLPDMCEKATPAPASQPQLPFGNIPTPLNFPPPSGVQIPPSIQSAIAAHQKSQAEEKITTEPKRKDAPGCPPGPPPDLLQMRDLDSDYESEDSDRGRRSPILKRPRNRRYSSDRSSDRSDERRSDSEPEVDVPKPTSVQQRMLAIAGQKYDDFMKELESVHSQADDRQSSKHNERKRSDDDSTRSEDDLKRDNDEPKQKPIDSNANSKNMKESGEPNAPPALRKENPAAIPNMSSIPAPPMPPPMLHKMPRPPPPPMGKLT